MIQTRKLQLALALNKLITYALWQERQRMMDPIARTSYGSMRTYRCVYGGGEMLFYDISGMRRRMKQILRS